MNFYAVQIWRTHLLALALLVFVNCLERLLEEQRTLIRNQGEVEVLDVGWWCGCCGEVS